LSKLSQVQKIVNFLKDNPREKFNARNIAEQIVDNYPEDYEEKRNNPRFPNENAFLSQIVAEIGSQKSQIIKQDKHIFWQDKPRPRVYWYNPDKKIDEVEEESETNEEEAEVETLSSTDEELTEHDLYPILINYLNSELKLYCQRIDERKSRNSKGSGGNQWLHPDIVAMQPIDKEWDELIRNCVQQGAGQSVRLWSF